MSKYFITFGGGSQNYIDAGNRLIKQAKLSNLFNKIILYTDEDLKNDTYFWTKHGEFINNNKRGYGYWLWKSYIIKKTMDELKEGDTLMYLDCGCEIDINKKKKIKKFFEYVKKNNIIGSFTQLEKYWNKMDLILHLNILNQDFLNSQQHQAGAILFYITDKTKKLVNRWYELSCNYHLIDDSPSIKKNIEMFKQHRHDQSIFSLLTKKWNIYSERNIKECIEYNRNRSGISKI